MSSTASPKLSRQAQADPHPKVIDGGGFDPTILARNGITFYNHTTSGAVAATLPNLSDITQAVIFIQNQSASDLTITDAGSGSLALTIATAEGAVCMWLGSGSWGASLFKATTIT